jgi:hypothetical protein
MTVEQNESELPGFTDNQAFLLSVFQPFAFGRVKRAHKRGMLFVHYTTADTAMRIFENNEIWLRKSTCMNDFMEIEHGLDCLSSAYDKNKDLAKSCLGGLFPDIPEMLEQKFRSWLPDFRTDTYIACVSEHGNKKTGDEEDRIGRLSMWRAYGGSTGVAIVMNNGPFLRPSDALNAYTNPVAYLGIESFEKEFLRLLKRIQSHTS